MLAANTQLPSLVEQLRFILQQNLQERRYMGRHALIRAHSRDIGYSAVIPPSMRASILSLTKMVKRFLSMHIIPDSTVVAAYKIATNIPTALQFIPAAIIVYIYPHFARNKDNGEWLSPAVLCQKSLAITIRISSKC